MRKVREVRCQRCGKLLFKIIDDEYIEIYCTRNTCKNKLIYKIPEKPLTEHIPSGKIVLK